MALIENESLEGNEIEFEEQVTETPAVEQTPEPVVENVIPDKYKNK